MLKITTIFGGKKCIVNEFPLRSTNAPPQIKENVSLSRTEANYVDGKHTDMLSNLLVKGGFLVRRTKSF